MNNTNTNAAQTTRNFVIISDPNYSMGGGAEFRVHAEGCRDIERHKKHPKFTMAGSAWNRSAATAAEAVKLEVADFEAQEQGYTADSFLILPCCK